MNVKRKFTLYFLLVILVLTQLLTPSIAAATTKTTGMVGVNKYLPYCGLSAENRVGASYCKNLASNALASLKTTGYTASEAYQAYSYYDNNATKAALVSTNSNPVTLFAFAGHGLNVSSSNYNTFHVAYYNGATHSSLSGGEYSSNVNFTTLNARFPHQYVVAYSCNWLTNNGSTTTATNILKTMCGTRLMMGFASQMYMDSREGTLFGQNLYNQNVINAFLNAARYYQTQNSVDVNARVVGYAPATNDKLATTHSGAPTYASSPSSFSILTTVKITGTGVHK